MAKLGPTGDFPAGKLNRSDEGGLKIGISVEKGTIIIGFGKPISWIGFGPTEAEALIDGLNKAIAKARGQVS
jgi:hypothetical protein